MKQILITIAAVVLVGCGESQQSVPQAQPVKPVTEVPAQLSSTPLEEKPVELVAETEKPEPTTAKAPDNLIHKAAITGDIEAVKKHLIDGVDVDAKDRLGSTPLAFAALYGYKEVAELLIEKGADVNARNNNEGTPLHMAVFWNRKEVAKLLLSKGADVNAKDNLGDTSLDTAYKGRKKELYDLLKIYGGKSKYLK